MIAQKIAEKVEIEVDDSKKGVVDGHKPSSEKNDPDDKRTKDYKEALQAVHDDYEKSMNKHLLGGGGIQSLLSFATAARSRRVNLMQAFLGVLTTMDANRKAYMDIIDKRDTEIAAIEKRYREPKTAPAPTTQSRGPEVGVA